MKKILTTLLILTLTVSMNAFCSFAYADTGLQGEGTEENPYLLYTRADLFCVNNDVNASYKLMGDIDLEKQEFTPVGNAEAGAFAGIFDGNGYTISNLKVSSGKYAALFGCNEGTVKNIVLKNIDVRGTRYAAGVVAENAEAGLIADCKVLSGKVQGMDGLNPLNIGGICGLNGGKLEGVFENRASVKSEEISSIAGGIVGKSTADIELSDVRNYGDITGDCAGGIVGNGHAITVHRGGNYGEISNPDYGVAEAHMESGYARAAGIVCNAAEAVISQSFNCGKIVGGAYAAGVLAKSKHFDISESYNSGFIQAFWHDIPHHSMTATNYTYTGKAGIVCAGTGSVKDSYNSGNIGNCGSVNGLICGEFGGTLKNVFNVGFSSKSRGISGENSYTICIPCAYGYGYGEQELQKQESFQAWNFDSVWKIEEGKNSGYPFLHSDQNQLQLNYSNKIIPLGESLQLIAYKNGVTTKAVTWKVVEGNVTISSSGKIKADCVGTATITAIDEEMNRANCNIYIVEKSPEINLPEKTVNLSAGSEQAVEALTDTDYIVSATSSDESILTTERYTKNKFVYTPKKAGRATCTVELASGERRSFTFTVVDYATYLKISKKDARLRVGHQLKLEATIEPNPTSSTLTWNSSNPEVATVDQEGNVTGKAAGEVTITAQTDNGLKASCEVTVFKPIERIEFETKEVTVYKGDTVTIKYNVYPEDATENWYLYIDTYYRSYLSASVSNGIIKIAGEKSRGSSSWIPIEVKGEYLRDSFSVRVIDYPTIVTGVTLDQTKYDMKTGEVFKLNATVVPSNATDKSITWATTDSSVASVSEVGTVSAVGAGKAVITATSGNGVIAACEVTVTGVASTNLSRIYIPEIFDAKSEIINVPVMIEHNPGISFINFSVSYDKEKMVPLEINNGALFESVMGSIDAENGKIKLIFSSDTDITKSGVLAKIKFKRKNMEEDITDLSVSYYPDGVMNKKQKRIALKMSDGRLNAYRSTICGDVDENRKVDFADALYFKRYLANWSKYQDISLKTANLDSDNEITPADLIILERHIAGWTGYQNIPQNQN